jgi:CheY-like chemotaxis protein
MENEEKTTPASPEGPTVLVVEDDQFLVRAYEVMLESQGYHVRIASDGVEALDMLREDPLPAVVLLDLMLPRKSGFEVLEAMAQDPRMQKVPVIVLSNLGQITDIERAQALGAKAYFVKADTPLERVISEVAKHAAPPLAVHKAASSQH